MAGQLRLLLWKDYLLRKRRPITIAGVFWAVCVIASISIVRFNIDNEDFPTCQFAARALPSAGILTFLQSYICNVNNECSAMDQFQEIPTYEKSRLTQLRRQMAPLISNASVMDMAGSIPDALKLVSTLADVADDQEFLHIAQNGLNVRELFNNPNRVKRYLSDHLDLSEDVADSVLSAQIGLGAMMNLNISRCNVTSMGMLIKIKNEDHLRIFVERLCTLSKDDIQTTLKELLPEINIGKYIIMAGNMYNKLSGDNRLMELGAMTRAALRMLSMRSFLPPEVNGIVSGDDGDFSYVHLSMIDKFMNLFKPTFGDTPSYKTLKDVSDAFITGVKYLNRVLRQDEEDGATSNKIGGKFNRMTNVLNNALEVTPDVSSAIDPYSVITRITSFILKFLPKGQNHDVLFYSTLLSKLIQVTDKMIRINMNVDQLVHDVSLRNPKGVKVLKELPLDVIAKGLEGLADPERAQIITSHLERPGQSFCDINRIMKYFIVSKQEAIVLKSQLCTDAWKEYMKDMITSFGTYEAKDKINEIASLFIQEALGGDVSSQLYTIDKDFEVLKNLTDLIAKMDDVTKPDLNWNDIFDPKKDAKFLKVVKEREGLGKLILLTVHGALAKEVVKQNPLLEYKISPFLKDTAIIAEAIKEQLNLSSKELAERTKKLYPDLLKMIALTALDEAKTYKSLSTSSNTIFCNGARNASEYINLAPETDAEDFVSTYCAVSAEIDDGLRADSILSKAIQKITNASHNILEEVPWTKLITDLKQLYMIIEKHYPYVLEFRKYGMDRQTKEHIAALFEEANDFWFSFRSLKRVLLLSINVGLRAMDMLNYEAFGLTGEVWLKMKYYLAVATGPAETVNDFIDFLYGVAKNITQEPKIPPKTAAVLSIFLKNLPQLIIETIDIVIRDSVEVEPIIQAMNADIPWPCGQSLSTLGPWRSEGLPALETLLCFDDSFWQEWQEYIEDRNITLFKTAKWNTTRFEPHVFLKFSSAFDRTVENFNAIKEISQIALSEIDGQTNFMSAWKYTVDQLNTTDRDVILRKCFTKIDTVLNAINTSNTNEEVSLHTLWLDYLNCSHYCGRAVWRHSFSFLSLMVGNFSEDAAGYLTEAHEANSTILQKLGFTRNTVLYMMYEKLPDLMAVLVNSYWDLGFMNQVRRATHTHFWDCEALVSSLNPGPDSAISSDFIQRTQPFVCTSLLYWISMPRGANVFMDIIAKPQYLFFKLNVSSFESSFDTAYASSTRLTNLVLNISKESETKKIDLSLDSLRSNLASTVDTLLSYKLNADDPSYIAFNEMMKKLSVSTIYLTRTVAVTTKISELLNTFNAAEVISNVSDEDRKAIESDLSSIKRLFMRRSSEIVGIHFDIITDVLWTNRKDYKITNALEVMCDRLNMNDTSKEILGDSVRIRAIICSKQYKIIYNALQHVMDDDFKGARSSLLNMINVLQNDSNDDVSNVFKFLSEHQSIVSALKRSTSYASDLPIPIYLKYLQSSLQHYAIALDFLAGGDWWQTLRSLYQGPYATSFFNSVEISFDIVDDVLNNLDKIHIIRLIRDTNMNDTESFCQANFTISEYIPDETGRLATLQTQLCDRPGTIKEIPPLVFASQGYDDSLKLPSTIDYPELDSDISEIENKLSSIIKGPITPQRPHWVNDENLQRFRSSVLGLLSKETLTKMSFGLASNLVDAGTLYLNTTCPMCSQPTSWAKQLTLQLFKRPEYDRLLCSLHTLTLEEVHLTLKNDFHWDMAISELISTRDYTKYELNKSLNELLEQMKLNLLEDITANSTKLSECLTQNITRSDLGNATLITSILSRVIRLLRADLPYLKEVDGLIKLPYFKDLHKDVAHNLNVKKPLVEYLINNNTLIKDLNNYIDNDEILNNIKDSDVNLRTVRDLRLMDEPIVVKNHDWYTVCETYNCTKILDIVNNNLNLTFIDVMLPKLQTEEFWKFTFITNILQPEEMILEHSSRLLGFLSNMDIAGVSEGKLSSLIDVAMQVLMDDTLNGLTYSINGVLNEVQPLLRGTDLDLDIQSITKGLDVLHQVKQYVIENDISINISEVFSNPDQLAASLKDIGFNNTKFWSEAGPALQNGRINLKPIFSPKHGNYRIKDFVCYSNNVTKVLTINDPNISSEEFNEAVIEQFCDMEDDIAKQTIPVLVENLNFSFIFDKVKSFLLTKLYSASNLTTDEGNAMFDKFADMAALLPAVRRDVGDITDSLAKEPLFEKLKGGFSFSSLMSSGDMLADVGLAVCGRELSARVSRIYRSVVGAASLAARPDPKQLEALPTDFCRTLYTEVVGMEGGKIVWSFVKPLLMGKVLYTPPAPAVRRIVEQANVTFAPTAQLFNLVHSFARAFPAVNKMADHKDGLKALQQLLISDDFKDLRVMMLGDVPTPDVDVDELLNGIGNTKSLGDLLQKASDLLQCLTLDRFVAMPDEHSLALEAARLTAINEFTAGLVFLNMSDQETNIPTNVEYKIRMDIENAPSTKHLKNYMWTPGPESSFLENMRYFRGFVQVQDLVEKAVLQLSSTEETLGAGPLPTKLDDWAVYTQQNPYPCYRKDLFQSSLYESQALMVAFFFAFLLTVTSAVRFILTEKESGHTMLMSVMGVNLNYHTLSWFLSSLAELVLTMVLVSAALYVGRILPKTDPSLTFTLLMIFGLSMLSFCYLMGKLFSSASVGAVVAALAFLTTFMPYIIILSLEAVMTSSLKMLVSLSMSSAFCYAFLFIARFEAVGVGARWAQLWDAPDGGDMNIASAALMMILDAGLYFIVGLLVERFWGLKKVQSNITHLPSSEEEAGVSIINVSKVYAGTKPALSGVSVKLRSGQVTALLGHNGAGKSTLINILTGMLAPTSGQVVVRGPRSARGRGRGRGRVGVCPQRDVLYAQLSAREHVQLYARLNHATQEEVDSVMRALSLDARQTSGRAGALSGGARRRVCVALAFVGAPALVALDEPTAGVDPRARREIWSMIMRLRAGRTILLSTHHMDEAELLSDQLIVLHKGQVFISGSPIEIKRSLGSGYKLSIMFDPEPEKEEDIEEKTKKILEATRSVAKNASLVDVSEGEVEINVPFFDEHGVSNDMERVCGTLEARGWRDLSADCASLEAALHAAHAHHSHDDDAESDAPASTSSSSVEEGPLVPPEGPLRGSALQQFLALLHKRYLHYTRNRWLLFLLIILPSLFVSVAMGFASIRPPIDDEISLKLDRHLYEESTDYLIPTPSRYSLETDPNLAEQVMNILKQQQQYRNWTQEDTLTCKCTNITQQCDVPKNVSRPELMVLPDAKTLNDWIVTSQQIYIEKRYGGFSSALANNITNLIAWYNNKGHHALPAYMNELNTALRKALSGNEAAKLTLYTHPLKISHEQLNKGNVYQHVADAGISAMLLLGYNLVSSGAALYLVGERTDKQKRLQLLCGVSPALYWGATLLWDMLIIAINMALTVVILKLFNFPVFVARNNLPAICLLIALYGYACAGVVHLLEKLFSDASLANMILFCGNTFVAVAGIAVLLILDIISDSDATDNARWWLHKLFLVSPQFVFADGLLEIAKNTIQAQVLAQFDLDTYLDPLTEAVVRYHYIALAVIGTILLVLNLAIEYSCFDDLLDRWYNRKPIVTATSSEASPDVVREERRVLAAVAPVRLNTIGNINAGYIGSEEDIRTRSLKRGGSDAAFPSDVLSLVCVHRHYRGVPAVTDLTFGLPPGQCAALIGANGAGKSTTFKLLAAELRPSAGRLHVQRAPATRALLTSGLVSYCPQEDALDPLLTVEETLQFYCRLRGLNQPQELISRTIDRLALRRHTHAACGALSGGTRRKTCTAIAIMGRAPLVLLDEPTSGLDPGARAQVRREVSRAASGGRAVLLATHALSDARAARRVLLLRAARLAAVADPAALHRYGGGFVVCARVWASGPHAAGARGVWPRVAERVPRAQLTVAHAAALHFYVPSVTVVDGKEVRTLVSEVFGALAALQRAGLLRDYTLEHTSLEQMFLHCDGQSSSLEHDPPSTPLVCPSPHSSHSSGRYRRASDELSTVTSL